MGDEGKPQLSPGRRLCRRRESLRAETMKGGVEELRVRAQGALQFA